jgi:5-formyltetrahydrofolate cyclo-ligase
MDRLERKKLLRKQMETKRDELTAEERREKSARICGAFLEFVMIGTGGGLFAAPVGKRPQGLSATPTEARSKNPSLMAFLPMKSEVNVTPIIEEYWEQGHKVAAPKAHKEQKMLALHWIQGYSDLDQGAWGIREPRPTAPPVQDIADIGIILVPGLAFDASGGRLGYGGGFYDRFIDRYRAEGKPTPILAALAYDLQLLPGVPMDEHDVRMDYIFTESGIIQCS